MSEMKLYRNIWIFISREVDGISVDVFKTDRHPGKSFFANSASLAFEKIDKWIDAGCPFDLRTMKRKKTELPYRIRWAKLPNHAIPVSDKHAYFHKQKRRVIVSIGIFVDGEKRQVFAGWFKNTNDGWHEARAMSVRLCEEINKEIERRKNEDDFILQKLRQ